MSDIVVALDYIKRDDALRFVNEINPQLAKLKVGKEMFTRFGPDFIKELHKKDFDVFLDLKFHDIPNTVAAAVTAAADLGVWMVNVHASGGMRMLSAAKEALIPYHQEAPLLIAVTVLTSMEQDDLTSVGINHNLLKHTLHLAQLTKNAELDGVVCSAQEATQLKNYFGKNFKLVSPGIRLNKALTDDQRRIMTPLEAQQVGVDYLVIGRPITLAANPCKVLEEIYKTLHD